jgi:hypothetical protein
MDLMAELDKGNGQQALVAIGGNDGAELTAKFLQPRIFGLGTTPFPVSYFQRR